MFYKSVKYIGLSFLNFSTVLLIINNSLTFAINLSPNLSHTLHCLSNKSFWLYFQNASTPLQLWSTCQCRGRGLGGDMPRPSCKLLLERLTAQGGATGQGSGGWLGTKGCFHFSLYTLYCLSSYFILTT